MSDRIGRPGTATDRTVSYKKLAAEMRGKAALATSEEAREELTRLADQYDKLAQRAEKNAD